MKLRQTDRLGVRKDRQKERKEGRLEKHRPIHRLNYSSGSREEKKREGWVERAGQRERDRQRTDKDRDEQENERDRKMRMTENERKGETETNRQRQKYGEGKKKEKCYAEKS